MNTRMKVATAVMVTASLGLLGACGTDEDASSNPGPNPVDSSTASPTTPGPTPSVDPSTDGAIALRGDWEAPEASWIVHFEEDGTFTEDFQGQTDFRTGKYEVEGTTVRLIGDDGNTDEGTVEGDSLVFRLGTLTRM